MSFAAPVWILVGALVLAFGVLGLRAADRRRRRDLEQFAAENILPDLTETLSTSRRRAKRRMLLGATACGFLALAGPEVGFDWEETQRRGIDILIAVDVSKSMLARDIQPDRLRRAKLAVDDLVQRLGGDRLGLIAFAGTAFLQCPLTLDHAAFDRSLAALEPGIISAPGSNLASALDVARKALESEAKNIKLLILFSDGEDLRGGAVAAAERAAEDGIHVFTVGVGTPAGELIPVPDDPDGTFVKDESGRIVKSRLDEGTLRKVAEITDGFYVPLGPRAEGIEELVERALAPIPREELASRLRRVPRNRYQWPLALAVLLLVAEPFLNERRRRDRDGTRSAARLGVILAALLLSPTRASAASAGDAARLYEDENFEAAIEAYQELVEDADDPRLDLNLGSAAYRAGAFSDAAGAFARALRAEDQTLREQAFYDLGNAQYRIGEETVETSPQETIAAWEQAVAAYDEALSLDENDEDARFNRDFVQRKLDELKQEQEQQDQDENEQDEENEPQDEQDEQEQESSDQQQDPQDQDPEQDQSEDPDQDSPPNQDDQEPPPQKDPEDEPEDEPEEPKGDGDEEEEDQSPPEGEDQDEAPPDGSPQEQAEPPPGQLSPQEARDLLDSLQGDEEFMPMVPMAPADSSEDPRDW